MVDSYVGFWFHCSPNPNTSMSAAEAKLTQSTNTYNSEAGVSLDEEAANLIRFQQAYAASAQIITAARAVFDSLLSAAR